MRSGDTADKSNRPYGVTDARVLGLKSADTPVIAMRFQAQKRPHSQAEVITLSASGPPLSPLNPAERLEAPMVVFDRPGVAGQAYPRQRPHR